MIFKLSGVSATDTVLQSSRATSLNLVHGDVGGKIVSLKGYWMFNCVSLE